MATLIMAIILMKLLDYQGDFVKEIAIVEAVRLVRL